MLDCTHSTRRVCVACRLMVVTGFPFLVDGLLVFGVRLILSRLQEYSITLFNRGVIIGVGGGFGWCGVLVLVGKGLPRTSLMVRCGANSLGCGLVAVAVEAAGAMLDVFADVLRLVALVPGDVAESGGELFSFLGCPVR